MTSKLLTLKFTLVCVLSIGLTGCAYLSQINPLPQKANVNAAINNSTLIPFDGDYQTAFDLVKKSAKSCFSQSNQVVKILQLNAGMPAQFDVFDRGSKAGEPLPADLRIKVFMEPSGQGGRLKVDTFSTSGEYEHQKTVSRFRSWLVNRPSC